MKNLIIASGNLGCTLKAAGLLAERIGGADIIDTATARGAAFDGYDNYIFGLNIRMFRLNKRFKKWAKKLKNCYKNKPVFVFLSGVDFENKEKYIEKARKIIPQAREIRFVGGELNSENAKGFAKGVIDSIVAAMTADGKPLPCLSDAEIDAMAAAISRG